MNLKWHCRLKVLTDTVSQRCWKPPESIITVATMMYSSKKSLISWQTKKANELFLLKNCVIPLEDPLFIVLFIADFAADASIGGDYNNFFPIIVAYKQLCKSTNFCILYSRRWCYCNSVRIFCGVHIILAAVHIMNGPNTSTPLGWESASLSTLSCQKAKEELNPWPMMPRQGRTCRIS